MNFGTVILKLINIYLIVFFYKKMEEEKENKKVVENEVKEEEKKDADTWYPINDDEQSRYKGEWKDGVPHGKGTKEVFEADSCGQPRCWSIIEGSFVNGFAEGYCKQTYKQEDGQSYYEGEFHNDKHHGQGAYYYEDGTYHKGSFKEGYEHGEGYYYNAKTNQTWVGEFDKNRKKQGGRWIDGELM